MANSPHEPLIIRNARQDEREIVRALTLKAYEQYSTIMEPPAWEGLHKALLGAFALDNAAEIIVAERATKIVGSVMLFPPTIESYGSQQAQAAIPELRLLAVATEGRGHGVGRLLVEACIARARQMGAQALGLHTSKSMQAAIHLYEDMGFVRVPERDFQPPGAELVTAYELKF